MPALQSILNLGGKIKVSPRPQDRGFVGSAIFGLRRWLEDLAPEIPWLLDQKSRDLMDANVEAVKSIRSIAQRTGLKPGDSRITQVIRAAEGNLDPRTLDDPSYELYAWWNAKRDEYATALGLEPGQRIENYFTHMVEPMNTNQLARVLDGTSDLSTLSDADLHRYGRIIAMAQRNNIPNRTALEFYEFAFTGGPHFKYYDIQKVPRYIWDPYVKERRGFPVYSQAFYDVVEQYLRMANRKVIMEPALADVRILAERLPENVRTELVSRIHEGYLGRPSFAAKLRSASLRGLDSAIRTAGSILGKDFALGQSALDKAFYAIYRTIALWDIGFNPAPIKKHFVADMVSIYAELGGQDTAYGFFHALSPSRESAYLRRLASTVGNVRQRFPDIEVFENYASGFMRGLEKSAFYPYQMIDLQNQYTAWIGAYNRAKRLQDALPGYRRMKENVLRRNPDQPLDLLSEVTSIQYANRVNQMTVPKQTPLDLPGILRTPLGKLAFQFSAKRMQRGELIWEHLRRAENAAMLRARGEGPTEWREITPFIRTIVGTAILTGIPLDEYFANKTGLDPSRIPVYDVLGKAGFGIKKVLYNVFPQAGPALQTAADIARIGHDPTRIGGKIMELFGGGVTGRELYTELPAIPVAGKKAVRLYHELKTGQKRSQIGGLVAPTTTKEALARFFGFDMTGPEKVAQEFALANLKFHEKMKDIHGELSQAYFRYNVLRNDPQGFAKAIIEVQRRYPDILITPNMVKGAILNAELPALQRLERRLPLVQRSKRQQAEQESAAK